MKKKTNEINKTILVGRDSYLTKQRSLHIQVKFVPTVTFEGKIKWKASNWIKISDCDVTRLRDILKPRQYKYITWKYFNWKAVDVSS